MAVWTADSEIMSSGVFAMTLHEDHARRTFAARASGDQTSFQILKAAAVWIAEWLQSCANHYAAAALYDSCRD